MFKRLPRSVDELYHEGLDALAERRFWLALRIASRLGKLGSSAAPDIRSLVFERRGKLSKAIRILREGTEKYPTVARLWFLLGTFLSDDGQYEEALRCFDQASVGHGAKPGMANHDRSIVFFRLGDYEQALRVSESVAKDGFDPDKWWLVLWNRARVLEELGRAEEAKEAKMLP